METGFLSSDCDDELFLQKVSVWRRDLDKGVSTSDDDNETSKQTFDVSTRNVAHASSSSERNKKYISEVRNEIEKWAKDSGYWQVESNTSDSSSDACEEIFTALKLRVADTITDAMSVHGETNDEHMDDQEIEKCPEDSEDLRRDSNDGSSSSNVGDFEAVGPEIGVSSTDGAAVIFQDEFGKDSEDKDDRNKTETSDDELNDAGFSSDFEIISPNISVYSLDTDSIMISGDKMIEDSADESQEWQEESDGDEFMQQRVSAYRKITQVMLSRNLKIQKTFVSPRDMQYEYIIKDLKKMRKILHRIQLRSEGDGSSSRDDETNFLNEKLAELVEQLVSFRKKNKVKSSSNLDNKRLSSVQSTEFKQKLDENPQNQKIRDDYKNLNQQMDCLNSASSSNLKLSSTQIAESDVRIETMKEEKTMEDVQNEKDDRHEPNFPKPIPMKFEDSKNEKDDRYFLDFSKPIPSKLKDVKEENSNETTNNCCDYNRENEVNWQSVFYGGRSSKMPAEVELVHNNTRKVKKMVNLTLVANRTQYEYRPCNKATFAESECNKPQNDEQQSLEIPNTLDEGIKFLREQLSENNRELDAIRKQRKEREKVDKASAPETQYVSHSPVATFAETRYVSHSPVVTFAESQYVFHSPVATFAESPYLSHSPVATFADTRYVSHSPVATFAESQYVFHSPVATFAETPYVSHSPATTFADTRYVSHSPMATFADTRYVSHSPVATFVTPPHFKPQIDELRSPRYQRICTSSSRPKSKRGVKACYYCHKVGHFARVCKFRLRNIRPVSNGTRVTPIKRRNHFHLEPY